MTGGRLAIHGHFYQPDRRDPFSGTSPAEPGAAPYHDWNARIDAECYRPNAERGNLDRISFDLGPTLATWLAVADPATHARLVAAARHDGIAQAYHHAILPLASLADRRTEVRWGIRDFEVRFGQRPRGLWLPETAVDLPTLRILAAEGIGWTILAPWQAAGDELDTRRPYRVELGQGKSIVACFYDGTLSAEVSFDAEATSDADDFVRRRLLPRLAEPMDGGSEHPLVLIATDGELYGHHRTFGDLFLERLAAPSAAAPDRGFDLVPLSAALAEPPGQPFGSIGIVEQTSWSCHHGLARWHAECPDTANGRWKAPLRSALERLAGGIDAVTAQVSRRLSPSLDPWAARDTWIDVILGVESPDAFDRRWLGAAASQDAGRVLDALMEAQRCRLAMFTSDGWFWDDPDRPETRQLMRFAARAARIVDGLGDTALEARLVGDLGLLTSPSLGIDGGAIYRAALREVGQPTG